MTRLRTVWSHLAITAEVRLAGQTLTITKEAGSAGLSVTARGV